MEPKFHGENRKEQDTDVICKLIFKVVMPLSLYVLGHNYNLSAMRRYILGAFVIATGMIHTHRYTHNLVTIYMTFVTKAITV